VQKNERKLLGTTSHGGTVTLTRPRIGRWRRGRSLLGRLVPAGVAMALALPAAASAQLLDPTLEQYAPSTQQIDKHVKGDGGGGQDQQGGDSGVDAVGADGQPGQGGDAGPPAGGQGGGGTPTGGQDSGAGTPIGGQDGGGEPPAGGQGGGGTSTGSEASGLDERVVDSLPLTRFDVIAMALVAIAIAGTAVALRRLPRAPRVGG
jgi:hypothetical protein